MHFLRHLATIPLCGFLIFVQPSRAQVITTIAGGEWLFRGDGGLASKAPLGSIKALGRDSNGNIYICDAGNHMVLKMTPAGTIHVVAGNGFNWGLGAGGFSGDGGPAVNAALYNPTGVAADAAGNLYICDRYNHRIRKVTPAGVITTVAGGGANDPGDGGPATAAVLKYPNSIALDASGNLYIADTNHDSIRRVAPDGTIATYAGGGQNDPSGGWPATSVALPMPRNITIDSAGNMYVSYSSRIAKIDAAGTTSAFAGVSSGESQASPADGPAKKVKLEAPCGLSADTAGNLYFVDAFSELVRRVGTDGMLTTVAGDGFHAQAPSGECGLGRFRGDGGPARQASFDFCGSNGVFYWAGDVLAAPDGSIYVADTNNHRVRQVDTGGSISTAAGNNYFRYSGDLAPATSAGLNLPQAVAVDAAGNVLVADTENRRIRKIAPGGVMTTVAGSGVEGYSGDGGPAVQASIDEIRGLAVDPAGNLLLADAWAHVIRSVAPDGTIKTVAGLNHFGGADASGDGGPATLAYLQGPEGVAADTSGNIFIADKLNWRVRKVAPSGVISTFAGGGSQSADGVPATSALLRQPAGVLAAPDGSVFIADDLAQKIRKVDSTGTITTVAGTGVIGFSGDGGGAVNAKLNSPRSPALGADGSLYFADEGSNRIRRIAPGGVIQTVAGNGTFNYSGDGGAATEASLASPSGIAVDSAGNLYIADWLNNRIRKVLGRHLPIRSLQPA